MSLTYGRLPRKHIWTFANAPDDITSNFEPSCECESSRPPFIGDDYFCDTGSRSHALNQLWYLDDPLWDGRGCGGTNTCCSLHNPPWFCKDLPEPTTEDIEMRMCGYGLPSPEPLCSKFSCTSCKSYILHIQVKLSVNSTCAARSSVCGPLNLLYGGLKYACLILNCALSVSNNNLVSPDKALAICWVHCHLVYTLSCIHLKS